jgi:CheY-like chemotaxis protein/EAL domain-containing protein (putative c-di-GMP-specific phosphodiesterase class I)/GGDEF domain-containing protein
MTDSPSLALAAGSLWIDLLRVDPALAERIDADLRQRGLLPRRFDRVEDWLQALQFEVPCALLTAAPAVAAAGDVLDKLALSDPRMASVLRVGYGDADQRLPALLAGADWFLSDPNAPLLGAHLGDWICAQDNAPFRVLVIDDDAESRLYCSTILRRVGMQVETFGDPEAGLQAVDGFRPDIVLLDLYMPGMDGLAVTDRLRASRTAPQPQIVFLSGEERPVARLNALRLGADDFLVKPMRPQALIAAVRSRAKRARSFGTRLPGPQNESGPRLRRGDFLQELERRQDGPESAWRVLLAVRVDQSPGLRDRLGLGGAHTLERSLATRVRACLGEGDRYSLWEEFGFGVLIERERRDAVESTVAGLLRAARGEDFDIGSEALALTLSIGMAVQPRERRERDSERWIASAFAAASVASQLGGNRAEGVLSKDPNALPPERVMVIHHALRDLARGGSLRFEFQPLLRLHGERGSYALIAKLRDLRAPLQGYPRSEYLGLAREQDMLATIDRMCLFHAFEAIAEQRQRGRASSILVPLDLAAVDARQLAWIDAELRRRPDLHSDLRVELDAAALQAPEHQPMLQRLHTSGIAIGASSHAPSLALFEQLADLPVHLLRLSQQMVAQTDVDELAPMIKAWQSLGREVLVDQVESMAAVGSLWGLSVDYLQGDALAAASPRPDYETVDDEG